MSAPALVLATDLDGTFLGGSAAQRNDLYRALRDRDDALLIYVTGRDLEFIAGLKDAGVPPPDYIVADVGTSVYDGRTLQPMADLEAPIALQWGAANDRVRAFLDGAPGLRLQPTPFRHRMSYDCEPDLIDRDLVAALEAEGFDCLMSADRFFDVLPRGVSKGTTLRRLAASLNLPVDAILVAGDTMNDLSLFQTGFRGVAVGNSEPRLLHAVSGYPRVHRSVYPGAAGIADAIDHFGLAAREKTP